MKNYVPLILAVLLGLAAVLAVGRILSVRKAAEAETAAVVAAARPIEIGEVLTADAVMRKVIGADSRPAQAISWASMEMIEGQKATRGIAEGDYILLPDLGLARSMGSLVGEGEWAVTLSVGEGGIGSVVQPGDEVAILGTFTIQKEIPSADLSSAPQVITKEVTLVLFPRVRVLDIGMGQLTFGETESEGGEIIVGLPPQEAQVLIAAQQRARMSLALRRSGDESALLRTDVGVVDDDTFANLLDGLESVVMPARPGIVKVGAAELVE